MSNSQDKGLIFDIKRFSINDGPGIRTTIFFKGCPLSCWWCHNPEGISPEAEQVYITERLDGDEYQCKKQVGNLYTVDELIKEIEKDRIFYETSEGGVTFSGGEPLMQYEFLSRISDECTSHGIHTCIDTSGYLAPDIFKSLLNRFDLFLYDLKTLDNDKHIKYTGVPVEIIKANLLALSDAGKKFIIRFPVIPGMNDDTESITKIKDFLKSLKTELRELHLLPYHTIANGKYRRFGRELKMNNITGINEEELISLKSEFEDIGYHIKTGG